MDIKLQKKFVRRFPHLYWQYYMPMSGTCMCWGFECGNGWKDMLWQLSLDIEKELDLSFLKIFKFKLFVWYNIAANFIRNIIYSPTQYWDNAEPDWDKKTKDRNLWFFQKFGNYIISKFPEWYPDSDFAVTQVKEKYATLRYYYDGGNEKIDDLVLKAEFLSEEVCEQCGAKGEVRGQGWYYTACDVCEEKRERERLEFNKALSKK